MFLKQSTAVNLAIGPFVLASDGDTEYASTFSATDVHLFKEGGTTMGAKSEATAPTLTGMTKGFALVKLDTTDTGTAGQLLVALHKATTLVALQRFTVLPASPYDALIANSGAGIRSAAQSFATDSLTAAALATDAVTEIVTAVQVSRGWAGLLAAGGTNTITLGTGSSAVDGAYNGFLVVAWDGAGANQYNIVKTSPTYNGTTKVATMTKNWPRGVDNTTYVTVAPLP